MKNSTFVASALSALMLAACQTGPKVVENPLIESANSMTLDIAKVELTDTAIRKLICGQKVKTML